MNKQVRIQLEELLIRSLEGAISEEQIACLNQLLANDTEQIRYAVQYLQVASGIKRSKRVGGMTESWGADIPTQQEMKDYLAQLLEMERTAPAVETEAPQEEPSTKAEVAEPTPGRGNRFWMYTAVVTSAAVILFVLSISITRWILPQEVATFTSNFKAQWDLKQDTTVDLGQRLLTKTPLRIQKGLAELTFDDGAKVVVEAPARFELLSRGRMMLYSGRLSALVSDEAQGFTVDTATSRVIDLGTEFGIEVSKHGGAVVQMYEGKARLSLKSSTRENMIIDKGQAREVSASGSTITEVPFEPQAFVTSSRFVSLRDGATNLGQDPMAMHPALYVHLDASRATTVNVDTGGTVRSWGDISEASVRHDAILEAGMARYVADALGQGLGAIDFGDPNREKESAPTQMRLLSQLESKVFLDQTPEHALGFTVALVVRAQSRGAQSWCNLIGNTSVIHVSGFFVRWNSLDGQPMAAAFLGGQELLQECAFIGNTVVLVCCYDRKSETLSLWNSSSNQTSRKTVKPGDYATWNDTRLASDLAHDLYLGAFGRNKKRYFDGMIGEVRIYRQALDLIEQMSLKDELVKKWNVTLPDV